TLNARAPVGSRRRAFSFRNPHRLRCVNPNSRPASCRPLFHSLSQTGFIELSRFPPFGAVRGGFHNQPKVQGLCGRGPDGAFSMSKKFKGRIEGPFVALLKDTMKTEAWKALSHGARSLYVSLRSRYNPTTQNAVYVSTRKAKEELGQHSNLHNVRLWFRE